MQARRTHLALAGLCTSALVAVSYVGAGRPWPAKTALEAMTLGEPGLVTSLSSPAIQVTVHAAVAVSLLLLASSLLGHAPGPGPMLAAVTFGVLPVCVDAVMWTATGFVPAVALAGVAAVLLYLRRSQTSRWLALGVLTLLALVDWSAVCLAPVLLACDLFLEDGVARLRLTSAGAGLVFVAGLAARFAASTEPWAIAWETLRAWPHAFEQSLPRVLAPWRLQAFEPYEPGSSTHTALAAGALVALSAVVVALLRRYPGPYSRTLAVGWFWCVLTLLPAAVHGAEGDALGGRFAYLPALGLALITASGSNAVFHWLTVPKTRGPWWVGVACLVGSAWLVLGFATAQRVHDWRSSRSLFEADLAVRSDNPVARRALALIESKRGAHATALAHAREAERVAPNRSVTWRVSASVDLRARRVEEAVAACERGLQAAAAPPDLCFRSCCDSLRAFREGQQAAARDAVRNSSSSDGRCGCATELLDLIAEKEGNPLD